MYVYDIKIEVTLKLTEDNIDDILVTAFEGGINYWADSVEFVGEPLGEYASRHLARGGNLRVHDSEENIWHDLKFEDFCRGFRTWLESGGDIYGAISTVNIDTGEIDADCADAIIQYSIFGDVIYG